MTRVVETEPNLRDELAEVRTHIRRKYQAYACYAAPWWDEEWHDEAVLDRAIALLQLFDFIPANQQTWLNS